MHNYFFTFGQNHYTKGGVAMRNYWVRVAAPDADTARQAFINRFTNVVMTAPDKFSFQYGESDFVKGYYPGGEYTCLTAIEAEAPHTI